MAVIEGYTQVSPSRYQTLNRASMGIASVGLVIAGFLSMAHATGAVIPCGPSSGCAQVAADPSSSLWGIPVANFGVLAYAVLLILGAWRGYVSQPALLVKAGTAISLLGTLISMGFTYYAITVIHATCIWCLGSAMMMSLSFLVHLALIRRPEGILREARPTLALFSSSVPFLMASGLFVFLTTQPTSAPAKPAFAVEKVNFARLMKDAHIRGKASNPVTIVEFADLYCHACQVMHERLKKLTDNHPDGVSWVFHQLPLTQISGHELSYKAALNSELAARKGMFWSYLDRMYSGENQKSGSHLDETLASLTGDDKLAIGPSSEEAERVAADIELAKSLNIHSTPTYLVFVNGKFSGMAEGGDLVKVVSQPEVIAALAEKSKKVAGK